MAELKQLAVIGGGMAGHLIAHALRTTMKVTLIDPKTYVEVPMAVPRLLVEPDALPARIPYTDFLQDVRLVAGRATAIDERSVAVMSADGTTQTVPFDYAVIATGSRYVDPLIKAAATTEAERQAEIAAAHQRYRKARRVVIVGGGAVGVEIAAEFAETFPHVRVSLIEMGRTLLADAPSKFGGWAWEFLDRKGAEIILNDRVVEPAIGQQPVGGVVTTASGRRIQAEAIVWAAGVKIATEFVAQTWPALVEADGRLKTDTTLRLQGHPNIFVAGDVTNLPERRLAIVAGLHAPAVIKSLKALAISKDAALAPYKPALPGKGMGAMMIVSFGRTGGLSSLPFGQFRANFLARSIKSKDMFVGQVRKGVGLTR
jgi:NADH dehydrogenase FAD-containing subunit